MHSLYEFLAVPVVRMWGPWVLMFVVVLCAALIGRSPGPNPFGIPGPNSRYRLPGVIPAGFLAGFFHGILAPYTFALSLMLPGIRCYETANRGRIYDFAFLLGLGTLRITRIPPY